MTQHTLANALSNQGERSEGAEGTSLLGEAMQNLSRRSGGALPQDRAMTQNNLGNALEDLGNQETGRAQRQQWRDAEEAFLAALEIYTKEEMPNYHQLA